MRRAKLFPYWICSEIPKIYLAFSNLRHRTIFRPTGTRHFPCSQVEPPSFLPNRRAHIPQRDIQIRVSWDSNCLRKHVIVFVGFSHSVDIIDKCGDRVRAAGDGARSAVRADGHRCARSQRSRD